MHIHHGGDRERRRDVVPSLGTGSEPPPTVQDDIVNVYISLANSQLTIGCLPLGAGFPGLCPPNSSTIIADLSSNRR